jgi:hypothetical protein
MIKKGDGNIANVNINLQKNILKLTKNIKNKNVNTIKLNKQKNQTNYHSNSLSQLKLPTDSIFISKIKLKKFPQVINDKNKQKLFLNSFNNNNLNNTKLKSTTILPTFTSTSTKLQREAKILSFNSIISKINFVNLLQANNNYLQKQSAQITKNEDESFAENKVKYKDDILLLENNFNTIISKEQKQLKMKKKLYSNTTTLRTTTTTNTNTNTNTPMIQTKEIVTQAPLATTRQKVEETKDKLTNKTLTQKLQEKMIPLFKEPFNLREQKILKTPKDNDVTTNLNEYINKYFNSKLSLAIQVQQRKVKIYYNHI